MTYVLIIAFVLFALDYVHNVGGGTVVVLVEVDLVVGVCCMNSFLFLDIGANVTSESVTFVHAWLDPFWSLWGRWGTLALMRMSLMFFGLLKATIYYVSSYNKTGSVQMLTNDYLWDQGFIENFMSYENPH